MKLDEPIHRRVEHERSYEFHPSAYIIMTDGTEDVDQKIEDVRKKRRHPIDYVIVTESSGRQETTDFNPDREIRHSSELRWFPYLKVAVDSEDEVIEILKDKGKVNVQVTKGISTKTLTTDKRSAAKYGKHLEGDKTVATLWLDHLGFPSKDSAEGWVQSSECSELVDSILREVKKEDVE